MRETASPSYSGDGGTATAAQLSGPAGVAVAATGVVYIADTQNQRVRAVSPGGTISTLAGTGTAGFNGEIVLPRTAQLNLPHGVAADALGNWYVADTANNRIRKVQPGGNLFTIAGNGNASYFGDGGPATKGSVNQPQGVAVDAAGNVYIADTLNHAVRKVTPDGVINTLAGTGNPGYSGDGGPANKARLSLPSAVAVDANGNVYVADTGNNQVRRIDPLGTITTVDTGGALNGPRGVAVDRAGNVYIADTGNHRVRRVSPGALVTTIAGNGACCYSGDGGLALDAMLNQPWAVAVDAGGNVYVADAANNSVRMLAPVSTGITVSAVTNAASNLPGAVAPGELVVLYGTGLGGGADGAVQRCGRAAAVRDAGAGGSGGAIRSGRRAGAGGGAERGRGVGAGDGGVGADRARVIHGGRLGRGAGRGGESGRDAQRDGGSGGGGLGAVAVCNGRGTDLAGGCRWEVGCGTAAAAGGSGHGEDRRRGRGGALRGRGCGPDRRRDAGQRGGARRVDWRRACGADGGRSAEPGGRYGGSPVAPAYGIRHVKERDCPRGTRMSERGRPARMTVAALIRLGRGLSF